MPIPYFENQKSKFPAEPDPIEIDNLRRFFPRQREQVENLGVPKIIARRRVPAAALIPTPLALKKKIAPNLDLLGQSHLEILADLNRNVKALAERVGRIEATSLDPEAIRTFKQARGILKEMIKTWRNETGYAGDGPDEPPD